MNLWAALSNLLFARRCPFCHGPLESEENTPCAKCREQLPLARNPVRQALPHTTAYLVPLLYEGTVREALVGLKYRRRFSAAEPLAGLMAESLPAHPDGAHRPFDCVTWVPLSPKRLRSRGFDQSQLLAEALCGRLGWSHPVPLLKKQKQRAVQSSLKRDSERRANASGAYEAVGASLITGRRILLVDDVCTSGATLSECARVLLAAGAASVTALAAAGRRERQAGQAAGSNCALYSSE